MHGLYEWCLFCSCLRLIRTRIHQSKFYFRLLLIQTNPPTLLRYITNSDITDKAIRFWRAMQDFTIYGIKYMEEPLSYLWTLSSKKYIEIIQNSTPLCHHSILKKATFLWWNMSSLHVSNLWRDDPQTTN